MSGRITITLEDLIRLRAQAHGFSFLPRQPVHSLLAGKHASRLRGRGLAFRELRRYQLGDDVRSIDWRATARRRSPHVRVYDEERERPVWILVDQRNPMFFGSRHAMKSVAAAEVAALAAWRTLKAGDRVGGIVFNDAECLELRPQRSSNTVLRLLHEVTRLNRALHSASVPAGNVSLNHVLETALRLTTHDQLVVLVSDLDGADDETRELSTRLAAHNDMLVVAVYDPLGASLRGHSGMMATDRGELWEVPPGDAFAKAFQQEFSQLLDRWTSIFRNLRVPVMPISAAEPVADQVRGLFGQAAMK